MPPGTLVPVTGKVSNLRHIHEMAWYSIVPYWSKPGLLCQITGGLWMAAYTAMPVGVEWAAGRRARLCTAAASAAMIQVMLGGAADTVFGNLHRISLDRLVCCTASDPPGVAGERAWHSG